MNSYPFRKIYVFYRAPAPWNHAGLVKVDRVDKTKAFHDNSMEVREFVQISICLERSSMFNAQLLPEFGLNLRR